MACHGSWGTWLLLPFRESWAHSTECLPHQDGSNRCFSLFGTDVCFSHLFPGLKYVSHWWFTCLSAWANFNSISLSHCSNRRWQSQMPGHRQSICVSPQDLNLNDLTSGDSGSSSRVLQKEKHTPQAQPTAAWKSLYSEHVCSWSLISLRAETFSHSSLTHCLSQGLTHSKSLKNVPGCGKYWPTEN